MEVDGLIKVDKIYKGTFSYSNNGRIYSEETFEIFRDNHESTFTFKSEIHSRVSTGELLTINVEYVISKEYMPKKVIISKSLGKLTTEEIMICSKKNNKINYSFVNIDGITESEISTPPRFHITTPTTASSLLFILSKKFDATAKNDYVVYSTINQWEYTSNLISQSISMEKLTTTSETITYEDKEITGDRYILYKFDNDDNINSKVDQKETLKIFLSKHMALPYFIESEEGIVIKIKYLDHTDPNA